MGKEGMSLSKEPYLYFVLSEVDDCQGLPDHLPVTLVIDGGDFGTLALQEGHSCVVGPGTRLPYSRQEAPAPPHPTCQPLTFTRYR